MSTERIKTEGHLTGASLGDVQSHIVILLGVTGCVVCVVIIMAVLLVVLLKRRGRPASELPPPPAPHKLRQDRLGDVVLFHARAPPPVPQGDSDSIDSHLYCEIPDSASDHHLASSSVSLASYSVSDSAWTDGCLRHIACPSSDSSVSEEYLHLVDSVEEEEAPNASGVVASNTSSSNSCGI
ncbi:uncharacterized protein [Littorina saxatilis]|uniref:uncharacterized protein n=1 Tax=Littorina saxatilis TaxID=31220 RepID=UPI0038B4B64D